MAKYEPGHTVHGEDCMSEWGEGGRHLFSAETIAANHRLHMFDVDNGFADRLDAHTKANRDEAEWIEASSHPSYWSGGYNTDYAGPFPGGDE